MSPEGSSPNARRATKGGSMSNGKLHGFSERRCSSGLRRVVSES